MDKEIRDDHYIADQYQEFWDKADELASKEGGDKLERRDMHLGNMVMMFMATLNAGVEDCDDEDCEECDNLDNCKTQWQAKQN